VSLSSRDSQAAHELYVLQETSQLLPKHSFPKGHIAECSVGKLFTTLAQIGWGSNWEETLISTFKGPGSEVRSRSRLHLASARQCSVHLWRPPCLDTFLNASALGGLWEVPGCRHGQTSARRQVAGLPSRQSPTGAGMPKTWTGLPCAAMGQRQSQTLPAALSSWMIDYLGYKWVQNSWVGGGWWGSGDPSGCPKLSRGHESSSPLHDVGDSLSLLSACCGVPTLRVFVAR
jgi:hypothetical protein